MTMTREIGEGGPLDRAVHRLDRALAKLEVRVGALVSEAEGHNGGLFDQDRAKLAAELDAARSRERALEEAGAEASQALGRAIDEIHAALGADVEASDDAGIDDDPDAPSDEEA
jgi:hypothetical protein